MRVRWWTVALALVCIPSMAWAAQETMWDFRNSQIPGKWNVNGWPTVTQGQDGLHINATVDGSMMRTLDTGFLPDMITLSFGEMPPTNALIVWHMKNAAPQSIVQLPIVINEDGGPNEDLHIDLTAYPQWNSDVESIGFALPTGTNTVLKYITLTRLNVAEKTAEATRAFWTFDEDRPYTINFLWGPQLTYNQYARDVLFDNLPPKSQSGVRVFYAILLLVAFILIIDRFFLGKVTQHLRSFLVVFALLWIVFHVRMGLEILSYAKTDYRTYVSQQGPKRELRTFLNIYGIAEVALPRIPENRYGLIMPSGTGIPALLRYYGYPHIPVQPSQPDATLRHWLVFKSDNVGVNDAGELVVNGQPVSMPGKIIEQYESDSFLFETTP